MKERYHVSFAKMLFFDNLLENRYLFQILHTSMTIKNSENVVKSGYFENLCDREHVFFFFFSLFLLKQLKRNKNLLCKVVIAFLTY